MCAVFATIKIITNERRRYFCNIENKPFFLGAGHLSRLTGHLSKKIGPLSGKKSGHFNETAKILSKLPELPGFLRILLC